MEKAIKSFLRQFTSRVTNDQVVENIYIPNEEQKTLRIAKTVGEENRVSFNDTFLHHKKELDKLKFNR